MVAVKLTDEGAIKALKRVRIIELNEMIEEYPENEVDGRGDWEMIANEAGWLLDSYESAGTVRHDDLEEAKVILRHTKHGKVMPVHRLTLKPLYKSYQIIVAKDTVNEYNRLKRFVARLKGMGLYCPYC